MGQQQSSPTQSINDVILRMRKQIEQPPPPPDPVAICNAKRIEFGQLKGDVSKKQGELDSCYPAEAEERKVQKVIEENNKFMDQKESEFKSINLRRPLQILEKIKNTDSISSDYVNKLRQEYKTLEQETTELDQTERRYRRRFLDGEPQAGVPFHILGLQTSDDMVMLFFWISSLFVLSVLAYFLHTTYEFDWMKIVMVFTVHLGISYYCITMYG
jgi:hypothetical protein